VFESLQRQSVALTEDKLDAKNGLSSFRARGNDFLQIHGTTRPLLIDGSSNFSTQLLVTILDMPFKLWHWMNTEGLSAQLSGRDAKAAQLTCGKFGFLGRMRMLVGVTMTKRSQMSPWPGKLSSFRGFSSPILTAAHLG
jgi:hypothetical protein